MNHLNNHIAGNYLFLSGIAPYSSGVVAAPGHEIVHLRFHRPPPYEIGLQQIERWITGQGRPAQALCAVELRCPTPYTFEGFAAFNDAYCQVLEKMGLLVDGQNPIARTNIAPAGLSTPEPTLYACSYTLPASTTRSTFVVAGAGDLIDQTDLSPAAIVRRGETSPDALQAKAECVLSVMEERLRGLRTEWSSVTDVNMYTVQPVRDVLEAVLFPRAQPCLIHGVRWYFSRPPIQELEFEMDLRGTQKEVWIQ